MPTISFRPTSAANHFLGIVVGSRRRIALLSKLLIAAYQIAD
jgi:hypothetical protein